MAENVKTPEEIIADLNAKAEELRTLVASKADSKAIDDLKGEIASLKEAHQKAAEAVMQKNLDELKDIVQTQGEELTRLKDGKIEGNGASLTLEGALTEAFMQKDEATGKSIADLMKDIHSKGGKHPAPIAVKVAVVMGEGNTIGAGTTQVLLTENTGIISTIRKRELRYLANVSVGSISTERALWVEETDEQGTPIFIGEGDTKTQLSVLYVEKIKSVKKIAVYGKVTTEMMADLPQLIAYIQNNMMRRLDIATETQLFSGDDTGDNLAGLDQYATAFAAGDLAASVESANELDVMEAIANQVEIAFGTPNVLFIHPTTMSKIKLIKDLNGRPVWKDYVTITGDMVVSGMRIVPTTAVTAGEFIGGDLSVVNVLFRSEMGIQIGLSGTDFIENKKTMLIEKRLVQFVSANDTQVLVQGDFTTAIAAILAPPAV
jgi:HK97 family phage major capsid protein